MKKIYFLFNYTFKVFCLFICVMIVNTSTSKMEQEVINNSSNRVINLSLMARIVEDEQKKDIYNPILSGIGDLTGYSANCPLCGGHLACKPSYNVLDGTDTYVDNDYGQVRIVASSSNLPCGSIVRFNVSKLSSEPILAIVLDRGVLGSDLDLLTPSESYASKYVGRVRISYDVLRTGWQRD